MEKMQVRTLAELVPLAERANILAPDNAQNETPSSDGTKRRG